MRICTAPPHSGEVVLGLTLPDLLDEACQKNPNPKALNVYREGRWLSYSTRQLREDAEAIAAGLRALGLATGDRVALFMYSDPDFVRVDMGVQLAHMIDVPLYLTYAPDLLQYVLQHAEARAVVVSDDELLQRLLPLLRQSSYLRAVIVAQPQSTTPPEGWPEGVAFLTLEDLLARGREVLDHDPDLIRRLKQEITPDDVATIIYTSGTTGKPKGVMLTHQNLTFNVKSAFGAMGRWFDGPNEVVLSFLPLTHVFGRMMQYGYMNFGAAVYFIRPHELAERAQELKPTMFATVPRLLERIYERILEAAQTLGGVKGALLRQAVALAQRYRVGQPLRGKDALLHRVLDRLVYSKWRAILGGRLKYAISGGAALRPDLAHFFAAAGIIVLEGYGLTETSPVITVNRYESFRPGTVGQPIAGVEVAIAEDGEILTRGPHVMKGYFKNPEATRAVIDDEGWFHTGDIGELTEDCYLRITDRKKHLFKLSTGKYVTPQPIEDALRASPLVDQAVVVGERQKFAAALIFPNPDAVRAYARQKGLDASQPLLDLLREPLIRQAFEDLLPQINAPLPRWSQIRRMAILPAELTVDNEMLTPTLKVRRAKVKQAYQPALEALYQNPPPEGEWIIVSVKP
ncbi:MAG: long-chain fatty acid--CoA ligase [Chloroflexi bacterium]|nr:long-chain fatty acid--CoA ligase [Chloroflexota bacterium]